MEPVTSRSGQQQSAIVSFQSRRGARIQKVQQAAGCVGGRKGRPLEKVRRPFDDESLGRAAALARGSGGGRALPRCGQGPWQIYGGGGDGDRFAAGGALALLACQLILDPQGPGALKRRATMLDD